MIWEYLIKGRSELAESIDTSTEKKAKKALTKMLNDLGKKGWQLAYGDEGGMIFQRPKKEKNKVDPELGRLAAEVFFLDCIE